MRLPRPKRMLAVLAVAVAVFLITAIIVGGGDKTDDLGHAVLIETDFGASSEPIVDAISRKLSPT